MSAMTNAFNFIHSMEFGDEIEIKFQGKDSVLNRGVEDSSTMFSVESVAGIEGTGRWWDELDPLLEDKTIEIGWKNVEERLLTRWHEEEYLELVMRES